MIEEHDGKHRISILLISNIFVSVTNVHFFSTAMFTDNIVVIRMTLTLPFSGKLLLNMQKKLTFGKEY